MAQSSKFLRLDQDVLLEFIYHDQSNPAATEISVGNSGSHVKFLNTVEADNTQTRYLINELGGDVVNFTVSLSGAYIVINEFASRELQLENGKTYIFNLSALPIPANFVISGGGSLTTQGTNLIYSPNTNGTYNYSYTGNPNVNYHVGKIQVRNKVNPYYTLPQQETGNTIKTGVGEIGRYYAVVDNADGTRFALLDNALTYLSNPDWNGTKAQNLVYQTIANNLVNYDTVRLHLRTGFSFSSRGYQGFIFQVKSKRNSGVYNFFTSLAYLNSSNYEVQNPAPFILAGTPFSKFIEVKIPSLVDMYNPAINLDFETAFFGSSDSANPVALNPTANYEVAFKLIDTLTEVNNVYYANTGHEVDVTLSQQDEYQDITAVIAEAVDGDYFQLYGERDGSISNFSQYILNRLETNGDDITVFYDIEILEQIGLAFTVTFNGSYVQTQNFDIPINFRPIIQNANIATSFMINLNLRIYNETNNTQILKQASLIYNKPSKYGKKMIQLGIGKNVVNKVYNTIASSSTNGAIETFINSIRPTVGETRYVPVAVDIVNVMAGNSQATLNGTTITTTGTLKYQPQGSGIMTLSKVADNFIKFKIVQEDGSSMKNVSLVNADSVNLLIKSGAVEQTIAADYTFPDIDLSAGEVMFKIPKSVAIRFDQPDINAANDKFYINLTNGGSSSTLYYGIVNIV
jgi:hypothetical protein